MTAGQSYVIAKFIIFKLANLEVNGSESRNIQRSNFIVTEVLNSPVEGKKSTVKQFLQYWCGIESEVTFTSGMPYCRRKLTY